MYVHDNNVTRGKKLTDFIMSSILLSKTDIYSKLFFDHNVRYGNSVTFRIGVVLEASQYPATCIFCGCSYRFLSDLIGNPKDSCCLFMTWLI